MHALLTEGMTAEQQAEFDRLLNDATLGDDGGANDRRAYALAHGEL